MRSNPYYLLDDPAEIERLIRENPWATLVSAASSGLAGSHYPVLIDDTRDELTLVTHLGRPDEDVHELGEHELMVIVQGPHGYISPGWYGDQIEVPTWNFIVAHLSGVPEILDPDENFEVLTKLVEHFESQAESPRLLDQSEARLADAKRDSRGTVGLRLVPTEIVAKQKMSQNKPAEIINNVIRELEGSGPYANAPLAREMRLANPSVAGD